MRDPRRYTMPDVVKGKRFELRAGEQKLVVDHMSKGIYPPPPDRLRARFRFDKAYILMGRHQLEMTTPVAHKLGFALATNGGAALYLGGVVLFEVGGERYSLPGESAIQLGGVLLKKVDRADDWQRDHPSRRVAT